MRSSGRSSTSGCRGRAVAISKVMQLLPRAGREGVARLLKADRVLAGADPAARASYEERASHSEPALEDKDAGEPAKTPRSSARDDPTDAEAGSPARSDA